MNSINELISHNKELYSNLSSHITMLKNIIIINEEATEQLMKVLEDVFININKDMFTINDCSNNIEQIMPIKNNQNTQNIILNEMIMRIGYPTIDAIVKSKVKDVNEFTNKFGWLNQYYTCYDVEIKELVFYTDDINLSFLPNDNKLLIKSLLYEYNTCILKIVMGGYEFTLRGFMNHDQNPIYNEPFYAIKYKQLTSFPNDEEIEETFRNDYLSNCSNIDFVIHDTNIIKKNMIKDYSFITTFINNTIEEKIESFEMFSSIKQRKIIYLLLLLDESNYILANTLFEKYLNFTQQDMRLTLFWSLRKKLKETTTYKQNETNKLLGKNDKLLSFEEQILLLNTSQKNKSKALSKVKELTGSKDTIAKAEGYLTGFCSIPFGIYKKEEIFIESEQFDKDYTVITNKLHGIDSNIVLKDRYNREQITSLMDNYDESNIQTLLMDIKSKYELVKMKKRSYLETVRAKLDDVVYGQELVKDQLEMIFGQWLSGSMNGCVLGICGPPGTGKTEIIKNGLSKCLKDDSGNLRPFCFIPLGGCKDSSEFKGHGYTYTNSQWGTMVDSLISSKCMNPIFFFDELDKVSTDFGRDIINMLIHITDPTQNTDITDKYFSGVLFDFSKCLIIFSYNDAELIQKILRDRITELKVKSFTTEDKIKIIKNFTCPKICKDVGMNDIDIPDFIIEYIINTYTCEPGIRKLIEKIFEIIRYINLCELYDREWNLNLEFVDTVLNRFDKPLRNMVGDMPQVGIVNGLYATVSGIGGITIIQLQRRPGKDIMGLKLTGKLGDVMQESAECAKTLAWQLIDKDLRKEIIEEFKESNDPVIHIHCPDGAVPKDGPSAGITLTLGIYSLLTGHKINNLLAMTGEVDLTGKVKAIGGLEAKLTGAIAAGCTKVLIPYENEQALERLGANITDNLEIIRVKTIEQVLKHSLVN